MNFIKEPHIYMCMYKLYACSCCAKKKKQQKREITIFVLIFKNFSVESFNSMFTWDEKKLAILLFFLFVRCHTHNAMDDDDDDFKKKSDTFFVFRRSILTKRQNRKITIYECTFLLLFYFIFIRMGFLFCSFCLYFKSVDCINCNAS